MPTAGPNSGGTFANTTDLPSGPGINIAWSSASNAGASDDSYASSTVRETRSSQTLKVTNFGFAIPGTAIITQVDVEVERKQAGGSIALLDNRVQLYKADSLTGSLKAPGTTVPTSDTYTTISFAIPTDATFAAAEINDSGFGVGYAVDGNGASSTNVAAQVDHIRITVTYELPGQPTALRHSMLRTGVQRLGRGI